MQNEMLMCNKYPLLYSYIASKITLDKMESVDQFSTIHRSICLEMLFKEATVERLDYLGREKDLSGFLLEGCITLHPENADLVKKDFENFFWNAYKEEFHDIFTEAFREFGDDCAANDEEIDRALDMQQRCRDIRGEFPAA